MISKNYPWAQLVPPQVSSSLFAEHTGRPHKPDQGQVRLSATSGKKFSGHRFKPVDIQQAVADVKLKRAAYRTLLTASAGVVR